MYANANIYIISLRTHQLGDATITHIRRNLNSDVHNLVDLSFHFYKKTDSRTFSVQVYFFSEFCFPLILVLVTKDTSKFQPF